MCRNSVPSTLHRSNTFAYKLLLKTIDKQKYRWYTTDRTGRLTFAVKAVAFVAATTPTTVRTKRVNAVSVLVAQMRAGRTFIHLSTIEFVDASKSGETIAHIRADRILAYRIRMAMVAELITLLGTLINICN